ncbi:MAG: Yip1 family protein [Bacillota bacterium]|nr:Yip1 family protein [Bacillota bacterium]MDW7684350.1 Yip1 family protein [Bacillota bacterium]
MNQFIDDFYDILFKPALGMERVVRERSVWQGLIVYLAVSVVSAITTFGTMDTGEIGGELTQIMPPEAAEALLRSWPALNLIVILVFTPFLLFLWSAVVQISAELLGGKGRGLQVAAGIGYAQLPYILVAPFGLVARYLAFDVVSFVSFAAFIWTLVLKIEAIRAVHTFTRGRAALAFFLPVLALIAAAILFFLLVGSFLMPLMTELFPMT